MMKKELKKKILKISIVVFFIITSILIMFSKSFAIDNTDADVDSVPGFVAIILLIFRAIIAVTIFAATLIFGFLLGQEVIALNVETFIFNKFNLTSLKVYTGDRTNAVANSMFDNVAKWFGILFLLALMLELLVLIYITIHTVIKTLKQDPKKDAEIKLMFKDFLVGFAVLVGMALFIITIIFINNTLVNALAKGLDFESKFGNISNEIFLKVFDFNTKIGMLSLVLYIILATMGIFFFIYYLRRLIKVSFLIIISPIVAVTFSVDRRKGSAQKLATWAKMFIFAVFAQSIHALIYVALISVVVESIDVNSSGVNSSGFIVSSIILVSGIKFLWDAENIIKELFGIEADQVQGSAAYALGFVSQISSLGKAKKKIVSKAPQLKIKTFKGGRKTEEKIVKGISDGKAGSKKDNIKDEVRKKGKELSPKELLKAQKRKEFTEKISGVIAEYRPLKGMGESVRSFSKDKIRNMGTRTFKSIGKIAVKGAVAGVAAVASHATPKVGMGESAIAGAALAEWAMDKSSEKRSEKKFDGESSAYKKNLTKEAEQLRAIEERKEKLGEDKYDKNEDLEKPKKPESDVEESSQEIEDENKDKEESTTEKEEKTPKAEKKLGEEDLEMSEIEGYAKSIGEKSNEEISDEYKHARKESLVAYQKKHGKSLSAAKEHVDSIQKNLLQSKNFAYNELEAVDKNLLHRYLDLITKQKIDAFESNTNGNIKYKAVVDEANLLNKANRKSSKDNE